MLKVIELAFCCYAVTDMKRARAFYEGVLGLKPTTVNDTEHGQWTEYEFGPYALAIGSAPAFKPSPDGCTAAFARKEREIPHRADPNLRLSHGHDIRPGRQHTLHSQAQRGSLNQLRKS